MVMLVWWRGHPAAHKVFILTAIGRVTRGCGVAYSFQRRFVAPILAGTKRQTIRAERKRHARPGEVVSLYHGMRTRQCFLIAQAPCVDVQPIRLQFAYSPYAAFDGRQFRLLAGLDDFARAATGSRTGRRCGNSGM
jgi:hypothetical protein